METKTNPIFNTYKLEVELKIAEIRVVKMLWFAIGFVTAIALVILATF